MKTFQSGVAAVVTGRWIFVSPQSVALRRQGSLTFTLHPKCRDGSELGRCRMQIPFEHGAKMLREQLSVFKLFCRRSSIHLEWTSSRFNNRSFSTRTHSLLTDCVTELRENDWLCYAKQHPVSLLGVFSGCASTMHYKRHRRLWANRG